MLIIKNSNLSPIPQLQFIQNGTEIISYRSLTEKQFCGNLLIAVSICDQLYHLKFSLINVIFSIIKLPFSLQKVWNPGNYFCPKYCLPTVNRPKCRQNTAVILLQKISLCTKTQGFYYVFVIGKSGKKQNICLWIPGPVSYTHLTLPTT